MKNHSTAEKYFAYFEWLIQWALIYFRWNRGTVFGGIHHQHQHQQSIWSTSLRVTSNVEWILTERNDQYQWTNDSTNKINIANSKILFPVKSYQALKSISENSILKMYLVNFSIILCHFVGVCRSQINVNRSSIFVLASPNLSNASSLMCRGEECLGGFVRLATACHRETGCLGWFYDDTVTMSCLVCNCPADPSEINRHSLTAEGALYLIDTPRLEKGMQNHLTLVT